MKYFNHYFQRSRVGIPSTRKPCIERDYFSFRRTAWNWGSFLAYPTFWHKCSTSENAQNLNWCWFRVFKTPAKSESWNNPNRQLLNRAKRQFVSCTSNLLEQMYDFQKRTMFLQKWISNLPRSQSRETIVICIVALYFPHNNIVGIHLCDECKRSNASHVCHKLFIHFVTERASLFTDHRISDLPTRAKYRHFTTIWEQTVDNSPTDIFSSSLNWWSSMHDLATSYNCCIVLFANSQYLPHISLHDLPWHRTMKISFRHQVSPWLLILVIFP